MEIYLPLEDSALLQKYVKKFAYGLVLDMGTGSGIQALTAAKKKNVKSVLAVDINPEVKNHFKKIKDKKITLIISDLFSKVKKKKFDALIFNPPYLPQDKGIKDMALYGGKRGFETLGGFLNQASGFLKDDGLILVVFSNFTQKNQVDFILEKNLLEFELLEKLKLPMFEELYCYLIKKSDVLKDLNKKVKNIQYLAHGKRGMIYTAQYKNKKIALKVKKKSSEAVGRVQNEALWLEKINKKKLGPKLIFHNHNYLAYEFIEGDFILDFVEKNKSKKNKIKNIIKKVFEQCFVLDQLGLDKEEMHHPLKHIIVKYPKATLIDFERMHQVESPHNVTQFIQFVTVIRKLDRKKMIKLAQEYKNSMTKSNLKKIIKEIK